MKNYPTQEKIKQLLEYDEDTGEFTWLKGRRKGMIAGCKNATGYTHMHIW